MVKRCFVCTLATVFKISTTAYKNFFDSLTGKRKGKKLRSPRFKKRTNAQSAEFTKNAFIMRGETVYLAKIGDIKPAWSRDLPSDPSSVQVLKDCADRYFLSFVVEVEPVQIDAQNQSVGIDSGIKTFALMSNGEKAESPDYSRLDRKVRRLQRELAKQPKGARRREKTRLRIAKLTTKSQTSAKTSCTNYQPKSSEKTNRLFWKT